MHSPAPLPDLEPVTLEPGSVALIGGGPGALDLLTLRGWSLLRQADVVVADRLGPTALLEQLGPEVEVIDVGKTPGRPSLGQSGIGELLVERARAGHRVARLKGGDPFVLGRGGEEVLACRAAGVPVQVVPGVSSAIAGPAAADVPVTHRGASVAVHIVNAHGDLGPADLAALADPGTTTVLMMGMGWLPRLVAQARLNGIDPATPVAIVQEATLPGQRAVHGTLATIEEIAAEAGIGHPAVITVGRTSAEGFLRPPEPASPAHGAGREALVGPAPVPVAADPVMPVLIGTAHGTRLREGRDEIRAILQRVAALLPEATVREAYVDVQTPTPAEVVAEIAPARGDGRRTREQSPPAAVVVPLLLTTGFHVGDDIAGAVADHEAVAAAPMGPDPRLAEVMADRLAEAGAHAEDAVVMAVAGTRDPAGQAMAHEMGALLSQRLGREVTVAFIAAAEPSVPDAVARLRGGDEAEGRVVIACYLLARGFFHSQLEGTGADLVAEPLGDHPLIAELLVDRYRGALGT
ncbi:uroporphyrinogen-III C-methyltransferase [Brachybacterium massiliense]|uniref:uroporphyrinogen-III C-methyltransferase n=1 Tax=Brachybacterium massiliense TaxID=1755098 RepID=UPI000B3BC614|nr:uroporphyrinogen-III C-methyltransferase [Brachybacterium massiliense]